MHSSVFVGLSLSALACATPVLGALPPHRPDRNAFVDHKVRNTQQLLHEIKTDPHVADRYERHFGMNKQGVLNYLSGLHPAKLAQSGVYTIYSVPEDGHVKMHRGLLKKGEPLFFDRSNNPILVVKCGNPLVLGKNQATLFRPLVPQPSAEEPERDLLALREPDALDLQDLMAMEPALPTALVPAAVPGGGAFALSSVPATLTAGGGSFPWVALAPLVFPIVRGGGGGIDVTPAPEPMTMVPLGIGAACLLRRRRRRS